MHYLCRTNRITGIVLTLALCAGTASARSGQSTDAKKKPTGAASQAQKSSKTSKKTTSKNSKRAKNKRNRRPRGQQGIASRRVSEIQQALIREKYLEGEPTGVWDQRTKTAMSRYQADNGWQNKVTPDSRALIKLGLGPDHSNLINPDTADTGVPTASVGRR